MLLDYHSVGTMTEEPTNAEKMRALPWSVAAWAFNSVFVQLTLLGSVFVLFLSELGLSKSRIGDLLSFVPFAAVIALAIAPSIARIGYKRTFLVFFAARKATTLFILLTPWVLSTYGESAALVYVSLIVVLFSLTRSVGMTALYPWTQEYVPDAVRGKYSAVNQAVSTAVGFLALTGAKYVMDVSHGLSGFVLLMGVGVGFGVIAVWLFAYVPGGGPDVIAREEKGRARAFADVLRDRDFVLYLIGVALIVLNTGPVASFLPLFMREQVGLSPGNTVWLQSGALFGGLMSSYLWGWAADRYGSKPIMLSGVYVRVVLPIMWLLVPRESVWSLHIALGISVIDGLATMAWAVGAGRLLYTGLVPRAHRSDYMALYYGWVGLVGGLSNVTSGRILDLSEGVSLEILGVGIGPYFPLFAGAVVLGVIGLVPLARLQAESAVGVREFAGMFLHGNPILAMGSLIRYHRAKDETAVVATTEGLGLAKSPFTVDELLEALSDPRFNVRFEAIISIARMDPDDRLLEALIDTLESTDPAFRVMAAWGLGRMGDARAIAPLRRGLDADYRSVRAHSARSLATLGDVETQRVLVRRLRSETDEGLQIAYASALGRLQATEAADQVLILLRESEDERSRLELALALARMVGEEHHFIDFLRHLGDGLGSSGARVLKDLRQRLSASIFGDRDLLEILDQCHDALARDDTEQGLVLLGTLIASLPADPYDEPSRAMLLECADRLAEHGLRRIEYALLALHVLSAGWVEIGASR